MTPLLEEPDETESRIQQGIRFDRSISLGTLLTLGTVIVSAIIAYKGIISQFDHIERAAIKSDVMWEHFIREHSDISADDLRSVR